MSIQQNYMQYIGHDMLLIYTNTDTIYHQNVLYIIS